MLNTMIILAGLGWSASILLLCSYIKKSIQLYLLTDHLKKIDALMNEMKNRIDEDMKIKSKN